MLYVDCNGQVVFIVNKKRTKAQVLTFLSFIYTSFAAIVCKIVKDTQVLGILSSLNETFYALHKAYKIESRISEKFPSLSLL